MEIQNDFKEEKPEGKRTARYWLVQSAIILAVVGLGLFAVNQTLEYRYKSVFLQTPCNVCKDLNKNMSDCIDGCFKIDKKLYPSINGDWVDGQGNCYNSLGKQIDCRPGSEKLNTTIDLSRLMPINP